MKRILRVASEVGKIKNVVEGCEMYARIVPENNL